MMPNFHIRPVLLRSAAAVLLLAAAWQPASSLGPAGPPAREKGELVIGIREFLSDLPAMIADADGLYALEGVKVRTVMQPQGKDIGPMLLDGTADLAILGNHIGVDVLAKARQTDPLVVLACLGGGGRRWRLMASEGSGVSGLEGLRGKRLGIWPSSYGYHLLELILRGKKIAPVTVKVPMDPALAVEAVRKERLDAILAWEPVPAMLEEKKLAREIFNLEGLGDGVPVYLVARRGFAAGNPGAVVKVLRALDRATSFVVDEPDKAAMRAAGRLRVPAGTLKKALANHEFRLGLTCRQRSALAEANRVFRARKHNKVPAELTVEFDTAPLREFLRTRKAGPAVQFEEKCP